MSTEMTTAASNGTASPTSKAFDGFGFERLCPPKWRCDPEFHRLAEGNYRLQLELERLELIGELGCEIAAGRRIEEFHANYADFKRKCCGQPSWLVLGTARNGAVVGDEREILRAFGGYAAALGLANVNGWAETGIMGEGSMSQVLGWGDDFELARKAPLIGVPLKFRKKTTEIPFQAGNFVKAEWAKDPAKLDEVVWIAPKHGTIQTRTALGLFGLTEVCITMFCGGGEGTDEELATDSLGRQLRDHIFTHYSDFRERCMPHRVWIDSPMGDDSWFCDGRLQHCNNKLARGTIDVSDAADIHVIRIGKEQPLRWPNLPIKIKYFESADEAARYMMSLAISTYRRLQECYQEA